MNIFLHIGHHKTATTSFQRTCEAFRSELLMNGIAYPRGVGGNDYQHGSVLLQVTKQRLNQKLVPHLESWLSIPCDTLILSAEGLVQAPPGEGKKLVRKLKQYGKVHLIYTIRNWTEYLPSRYSQYISVGDSWPWTEFLTACKTDFVSDSNLNFGRVIEEYGAGNPDSFHLLDYNPCIGPSQLLELTGVEAALTDILRYRELRGQKRNLRFPQIHIETQRIVNMMVNLKYGVSPSHCFFNRGLQTPMTSVKNVSKRRFMIISRHLLSDADFRADLNSVLKNPSASLAKSKRPDFSVWAKSVDQTAAKFGLPEYAKNWKLPSGKDFWTCLDIRPDDLSSYLRGRIEEEIKRVEAGNPITKM